jgi:hypothetical protein
LVPSHAMRFLLLSFFATVLVGLPVYVLDILVMPQLQTVQQFYAHEDSFANKVAQLHQ